jgi:hypothetical protein
MRCSQVLSPLVAGFTLVALGAAAHAQPEEEAKQPPRRQRASEILLRIEEPRSETGSWLDHVGVRKGVGVVYRHQLQMDGDRKVVLSVGGPALKLGGPALKRKLLGLLFEIRF